MPAAGPKLARSDPQLTNHEARLKAICMLALANFWVGHSRQPSGEHARDWAEEWQALVHAVSDDMLVRD